MSDARHPSFRDLADLADGTATGPRGRDAARHVDAGCADCHVALTQVRDLTRVLGLGPLPAPPSAELRRARRLFAGAKVRAAVDATLERATAWVAQLVFDQRAEPAFALRSGPVAERRLLFNVGPREVYCAIEQDGGTATLRGQFLPAEGAQVGARGRVRLEREQRVVAEGPLDAELCFVFGGVPPGVYVVSGDVDGHPFELPPFVVE